MAKAKKNDLSQTFSLKGLRAIAAHMGFRSAMTVLRYHERYQLPLIPTPFKGPNRIVYRISPALLDLWANWMSKENVKRLRSRALRLQRIQMKRTQGKSPDKFPKVDLPPLQGKDASSLHEAIRAHMRARGLAPAVPQVQQARLEDLPEPHGVLRPTAQIEEPPTKEQPEAPRVPQPGGRMPIRPVRPLDCTCGSAGTPCTAH